MPALFGEEQAARGAGATMRAVAILLGTLVAHVRPELAAQPLFSVFVMPAHRGGMLRNVCVEPARTMPPPLRAVSAEDGRRNGRRSRRVICGEGELRHLLPRGAARKFASTSVRMSQPGGAAGGKKKKVKKRRVDDLLVEQGLADNAKVCVRGRAPLPMPASSLHMRRALAVCARRLAC